MADNPPATLPADFNFNGASNTPPSTLPADFQFEGAKPAASVSGTESHPVANFISGALESTPFPKFAASLRKIGIQTKDLSHDLFGSSPLTEDEQSQLVNDAYDVMPNHDKIKPISNNPLDAIGTGLQMSSYITPLGPETAGGGWAMNLLKMSAPFAVTQTLGGIATDAADGKSGQAMLGDAAINYLGSVAGFGIFKGLASGLKMTAGALLKSEVVKSANQAILDFMGHALSLDGRFAKGGANVTADDAKLMQKALEQSYAPLHKDAMDAFAQAVQRPTTWDDVYRGVQNKVSGLFDKMVKAKDAKYGQVFREDFFPNPKPAQDYAKPTFDALSRAKVASGAPALPENGRMSVEEARAFLAKGGGGEETALSKYADLVEGKMGTPENPNSLSMKDFDELFTSAPVSRDPIENKHIQDLATSVYQSAKDELVKSADPQAKTILQSWEEARTQWLNLRNMAGTKFMNNMKNVGDAEAFVEKMIASKPTVSTQKVIDGLDKEAKEQMSDIIYNMALQRSRTMNSNYAEGGKAVEKMLDSWSPTGLISPQHEAILRSYSQAMQGTYEDAAQTIAKISGGDSTAGAAIKTAAEAQGKAEMAGDMVKAMGGKPLYKSNPDGTFDFSNLTKFVDKINNSGEFDSLATHLSQIEDLNAVGGSKINAVVKGIFGATMFHQHPFVGLGLISSSLDKLFGKEAAKVTTNDISRLVSDLVKTGRLTPDRTSKFLIHMLQGDFEEAGGILAKLVTGAATKATTEAVNPPQE